MKKLFLMLCLCTMAVCANAQKFTVWYGLNFPSVGGDIDADSELKALNFGIDYSAPLSGTFDWAAGLAYVTKGCKDWDPASLQLDVNARWNFVNAEEYKVGLLAGPYLGYIISDDDIDTNGLDFGIGVGAMGSYRDFSLKLGYEFGITNAIDMDHVDSPISGFYIRLGYSF